jgi:hypothetical protein
MDSPFEKQTALEALDKHLAGSYGPHTGRNPMTDRKKNEFRPKLLSGGNPQTPKGEGNGPVH